MTLTDQDKGLDWIDLSIDDWIDLSIDWDPITERQVMIAVYNHLLSERYLASIKILGRWLDP